MSSIIRPSALSGYVSRRIFKYFSNYFLFYLHPPLFVDPKHSPFNPRLPLFRITFIPFVFRRLFPAKERGTSEQKFQNNRRPGLRKPWNWTKERTLDFRGLIVQKKEKAVLVGHEAKETHKQRAKNRKNHRTEVSWATLPKNVLRDDYTRFRLRHLFSTYTHLASRTITTKSKFSYGTFQVRLFQTSSVPRGERYRG